MHADGAGAEREKVADRREEREITFVYFSLRQLHFVTRRAVGDFRGRSAIGFTGSPWAETDSWGPTSSLNPLGRYVTPWSIGVGAGSVTSREAERRAERVMNITPKYIN
jgi:hypothetical protein